MTSRGPGRASRTLEMEEREQLRRQIRLLQGESGRAGVARRCRSSHLAAGSRPPPRRGRLSTRRRVGQVGSGGEAGTGRQRVGDAEGLRAGRVSPLPGFRPRDSAGPSGARRVAGGRSFSVRREAALHPHGRPVLGGPRRGPRPWGGGLWRRAAELGGEGRVSLTPAAPCGRAASLLEGPGPDSQASVSELFSVLDPSWAFLDLKRRKSNKEKIPLLK